MVTAGGAGEGLARVQKPSCSSTCPLLGSLQAQLRGGGLVAAHSVPSLFRGGIRPSGGIPSPQCHTALWVFSQVLSHKNHTEGEEILGTCTHVLCQQSSTTNQNKLE